MEMPVIAAPRARILVVDDSQDNLELMRALLEEHYQVLTTDSGEEALEVLKSDPPPDLILLDIVMPRMDGFDVKRHLGADPLLAAIPVIFLTGLGNREHEQAGLELGAVDFITKPICAPVAMTRIRNHLERSTNERRLHSLTQQLGR
jgi:adenylate cyclase